MSNVMISFQRYDHQLVLYEVCLSMKLRIECKSVYKGGKKVIMWFK